MPTARFTPSIAVFVALRNGEGEYLLQRRINTGYLDGYYDFSASGKLERYETLQECAVREAEEELGVTIAVDNLRLMHINQNDVDTPYINFTFLCEKWQGEPRICEPTKCDDLQFFAPETLPDKCTLNVRAVEQAGFSKDLTYSNVMPEAFNVLMKVQPADE